MAGSICKLETFEISCEESTYDGKCALSSTENSNIATFLEAYCPKIHAAVNAMPCILCAQLEGIFLLVESRPRGLSICDLPELLFGRPEVAISETMI